MPLYFDNIRKFSGNIIALDDGSTDNTLHLLKNEAMVKLTLTNPVRPGYYGWDDGENRRRLLAACEQFQPDWILWLDADELLVEYDIPRLLRLIRGCHSTKCAFGLEVVRLIGDYSHFDRNKLWVYRLFPYRTGYSMPWEVFHFEPVPTEIDRPDWARTRLRIAHRAGMTAAMRQARYRKYLECDPLAATQDDYHALLDPPGHRWTLRPLPPELATVIDTTR